MPRTSTSPQTAPGRDLLQRGLQRDRVLLHLLRLRSGGEFYIPESISCGSLLMSDVLEMHDVTSVIIMALNRDDRRNFPVCFVELYRDIYCPGSN
jgi:hypothetical protein